IQVNGVFKQELIEASRKVTAVVREPTDAELGSLGRSEDLLATSKAIDGAFLRKQPGLFLVATGTEDTGQGEFAQALAERALRKRFHFSNARRPAVNIFRAESMLRWMGLLLEGNETPTLDLLAAAIARKAKDKPVAFIIDPIDPFEGGIDAF